MLWPHISELYHFGIQCFPVFVVFRSKLIVVTCSHLFRLSNFLLIDYMGFFLKVGSTLLSVTILNLHLKFMD